MTIHNFFRDEAERRKWQNPEAILTDIGLKQGSTFIDLGCGYGFFALPAAKLVGEKGRVFGLDVSAEAIEKLKATAIRERLQNLTLKVGEAEKTILCKGCADIVFLGIVLHDFEDQDRVLLNAKKMLKQTGRLVNIDWKKKPMQYGPPLQIRFTEEEAMNLIKSVGFTIETVKDAGPYHYIVIAKP